MTVTLKDLLKNADAEPNNLRESDAFVFIKSITDQLDALGVPTIKSLGQNTREVVRTLKSYAQPTDFYDVVNVTRSGRERRLIISVAAGVQIVVPPLPKPGALSRIFDGIFRNENNNENNYIGKGYHVCLAVILPEYGASEARVSLSGEPFRGIYEGLIEPELLTTDNYTYSWCEREKAVTKFARWCELESSGLLFSMGEQPENPHSFKALLKPPQT